MLDVLGGLSRRLSSFLFLAIFRRLARWRHKNQRKSGSMRKETVKPCKNSVTQPLSFPVQWSATTKLPSVVRLVLVSTHLKPNSHLSWTKPVPVTLTTEQETSDRRTEGLKDSSQHSPGVKKTLTDVAQSPYTQSVAAFEEQPECSQATSPAPFMICNGIVEERQQHPHHRTKPT